MPRIDNIAEPPEAYGFPEGGVFAAALDAVVIMDARGCVRDWNPAAEAAFGYSHDEAVGAELAELIIPPAYRTAHRQAFRRYIETREAVILDRRLELAALRQDGSEFPVELTVTRVPDLEPPLFVGFVRDLSTHQGFRLENERLQQRLAFLAHAGLVLDVALDFDDTLRRLAGLTVPDIADLAVIDLLADDGSLRASIVASGPDASLAEAIEALRAERPVDLAGDHPVAQMIRGADSLLLPDVPDDFFGPAAQSEALGIRPASAIVVPLKARRSLVGALSLVRLDAEAEYDADDLLLARTLARRAALTIESAQAWIQTRNISKTLQASLLPRGLPEIPGLQLVGRYRAAAEGQDVGGDFYDAFEIADGRFGIAIGDVCGKGPEAAALTALARYTIRAVAERGPAAVLTLLNTSVLRDVDAGDRFLTALFAEVSQSAAGVEIEIAVAGHPPPLVRRADGEVERIEASGPLVGVVPAAEFATTRVVLAPGDRMLLYTDGLTDARAPRAMLSEDDLGALLSAGHALDAEGLAEFLELSATGDEPARDDIAIVVLEAVAGTDAPVTIQRYASES